MYLNSTITIIADYDTNMNVSDMYKMVNENGSTKKNCFCKSRTIYTYTKKIKRKYALLQCRLHGTLAYAKASELVTKCFLASYLITFQLETGHYITLYSSCYMTFRLSIR